MLSTMQDAPLSIQKILTYGTTYFATSEVATFTGEACRTTSYAEVGRRAAQLAHALGRLGVTGDERVGTFLWNNQEHLEAYLAVPSMGAVLHTLNPRLPADQLSYVVGHAEDRVVLVDGTLLPLFAKVLPQLDTVEHVVVVGAADTAPLDQAAKPVHLYEELLAEEPDVFDWPEIDERQAAAMCYTSGTTGNPKGVVYSHRSTYLHSMQVCMGAVGVSSDDRVLPVVPMFHAAAWGLPYGAMMIGASLVMPDRFLQPAPLARLIETAKPTYAAAVPTIWNDLLTHVDAHPADVSSLRVVIVGGSACPPALMRGFEERHDVRLVHGWGMTETSPLGALAHPPAGLTPEEEWRYRVTQGRLVCAVEGRLVGPDGSVLPNDGESVGELEVRGPWVAGSYYGDDDPERFRDGWLRTGDVGTLTSDGFFTITDRAKDVIKSGGEWISSVDLENHLMAHPAVTEATAVGVPDEAWGERPLAVVVLREDEAATPDELRAFLGERVPHWQLPERWAFVVEIPKTSVGKFDKKLVRRMHADGELAVHTTGSPERRTS